jgi:hypothetical protein
LVNEATRIANQKEVDFARISADMQKHGSTQQAQEKMERVRHSVDMTKTAAQIAAQKNRGNK